MAAESKDIISAKQASCHHRLGLRIDLIEDGITPLGSGVLFKQA